MNYDVMMKSSTSIGGANIREAQISQSTNQSDENKVR